MRHVSGRHGVRLSYCAATLRPRRWARMTAWQQSVKPRPTYALPSGMTARLILLNPRNTGGRRSGLAIIDTVRSKTSRKPQ